MPTIPVIQRLVAIIISLLLLLVTVQLIRKRKLREEYALLWLMATIAIVTLSTFGGLVTNLADLLNISYSPTLPLVGGLIFALIVLLSQSVVLSNQANNGRDLAQQVALLEYRLRELETQVVNSEEEDSAANSTNLTN